MKKRIRKKSEKSDKKNKNISKNNNKNNNKEEKNKKNNIYIWSIIALCILTSAAYLIYAGEDAKGFPLDDTYIHLVYIENFARHGWFYFNYPKAENGATSPLWIILNGTLALIIGWFIPLQILVKITSITFFILSAVIFFKIVSKYMPKNYASLMTILLILDPHISTAAVSGMEVTMITTIMLLTIYLYTEKRYLDAGITAGIGIFARPEGIIIAIMLILVQGAKSLIEIKEKKERTANIRGLMLVTMPIVLLTGAYFILNASISGTPLPNTYYAKKTITNYINLPAYKNITTEFLFKTPIFMLLIGFVGLAIGIKKIYDNKSAKDNHDREKRYELALMLGIGIAYMYALTITLKILPKPWVFYMSRYFTPTIAPILMITAVGLTIGYERYKKKKGMKIVTTAIIIVVLSTQIWALGGSIKLYKASNDYFDNLLTAQGGWFAEHVKGEATIGTFDVGAIKYLSEKKVIDLAGLNNRNLLIPQKEEEIIRIKNYLETTRFDYLATNPMIIKDAVLNKGVEEKARFHLCPEETEYPCSIKYEKPDNTTTKNQTLKDTDHLVIYKVTDQNKTRKALEKYYAEKYAFIAYKEFKAGKKKKAIFHDVASIELYPTETAGVNGISMCIQIQNIQCTRYFLEQTLKNFPNNPQAKKAAAKLIQTGMIKQI